QHYFNRERGTGGVEDILSTVHLTECAPAQYLYNAMTAIQDHAHRERSGRILVRRRTGGRRGRVVLGPQGLQGLLDPRWCRAFYSSPARKKRSEKLGVEVAHPLPRHG